VPIGDPFKKDGQHGDKQDGQGSKTGLRRENAAAL